MLQIYHELSNCSPSRHQDVYIFAITPLADRALATITSADELLLLPRDRLRASDLTRIPNVPHGLTSLVSADTGTTAICAGSDGVVAFFDIRTSSKIAQFRIEKPVDALACKGHDVAFGSDALVSIWDRRQTKIRWQNTEINDEVTALNFHPSQHNLLLSGGDDGLVSIFNIQIPEEEDSLVQAVSHGPIHKAGFLGPSDIYALSSDQNLALHSLTIESTNADAQENEIPPDQLGDLRPVVPCEYVIDIVHSGPDHIVACGSHRRADSHRSRVDLVKIDRAHQLNLDQRIVLEHAHGGEVVRSIFADEPSGVIFTAGEDGRIAAFAASETKVPSGTPSKASKIKKGADVRYKPY
ncbi:uncharacterized protein Z518_09862 [Rhinocladiella mackenziei CBS 650.93]|uniref:WD repeat protein n=1 Tax=Rhinocladiella mackenziei CBS 650.93 TaxID=1442369 RepID=A0A0D2FFK3_9EURO|nr:uncharacterized protein Z518_09862 [Rhinocladiella mackenziei CBS 650.93]KIX00797.1 hypothetical protein Z518_09862 [Rhinocladiella mackenziei CBS 650.93]